jgi:hypothetical protein
MNICYLEGLVYAVACGMGILGLPKNNTNASLPSIISNATLIVAFYLKHKFFKDPSISDTILNTTSITNVISTNSSTTIINEGLTLAMC